MDQIESASEKLKLSLPKLRGDPLLRQLEGENNFQILKQRKINRNMGKFLAVVLANHWKKNLSRFAPGGDLKLIYQRRMKYLLTFHAMSGFDTLQKKS